MSDEENCKGLLGLALEFPIEKVTVSKEKCIVYHPGYKGVRLDVIAKDCDYDPFDGKKYRYTWDTMCYEDPDIKLFDGRHTIFLSTCGVNDE